MKKNISIKPAPDYMRNTSKSLTVNYANLDIENSSFDFYIPSSDKINCKFHILFFTNYPNSNNANYEFVCMDITSGKIYHIKYESASGECEAIIKGSKVLDDHNFMCVLNDYEKTLPGLTATFSNLSLDNWKEYLETSYKQLLGTRVLFIRYEEDGLVKCLYSRYEFETNAHSTTFFEITKADYDTWKLHRENSIDDVVYFSELLPFSKKSYTKKHGIIFGRKLTFAVNKLFADSENINDGLGNMTVTKAENGLYTMIMTNVKSKEIEKDIDIVINVMVK